MDRVSEACALMLRFAERTGLTLDSPGQRYLWTDAFALCNFLGLARATGLAAHEELALRVVERVHAELGRFDEQDRRHGWLSGLSDAEARLHPTRGGLRIGKPLLERTEDEAFDPDLEWDRDGQYFHYLTKWMHALDQLARWTGDCTYNVWARELAQTAHRAFVYGGPGRRRMYWKLSVDLSTALVSSMGQHDPLDGWVTFCELAATARALGAATEPCLVEAIRDFEGMVRPESLSTEDPLGLGGLLFDVHRLLHVAPSNALVPRLLDAAVDGLRMYVSGRSLRAPAHHRLAFRELGFAMGIDAIASTAATKGLSIDVESRRSLAEILEYAPLATNIVSFWRYAPHRRVPTWTEHLDISEVMLATCLEPRGLLSVTFGREQASRATSGPLPPNPAHARH